MGLNRALLFSRTITHVCPWPFNSRGALLATSFCVLAGAQVQVFSWWQVSAPSRPALQKCQGQHRASSSNQVSCNFEAHTTAQHSNPLFALVVSLVSIFVSVAGSGTFARYKLTRLKGLPLGPQDLAEVAKSGQHVKWSHSGDIASCGTTHVQTTLLLLLMTALLLFKFHAQAGFFCSASCWKRVCFVAHLVCHTPFV